MSRTALTKTWSWVLAGIVCAGVGVGSVHAGEVKSGDGRSDKEASGHVRAALRAEFDPTAGDRSTSLSAALGAAPDYAPARWARGEILSKGSWVPFESLSDRAHQSTAWKSYRDLRRDADQTVAGQMRLADFCRKNKLPEQERAHLKAVAALDPENAVARKRLGEQKAEGARVTKEELDERRAHSKAVADALRRHKGTLTKLGSDLKHGLKTQAQAVAELKELSGAECIPALELYLSTPHESGALAVIAALATRADPEGSVSMVRHALGHPSEAVQDAAVEALKTRDEQSFIPALLASLQSPVLTRDEMIAGPGNQVIWRKVFYVDKQDEQQLGVLETTFHIQGMASPGAASATQASRSQSGSEERQLERTNQQIRESNQRTSQLLGRVTGETKPTTPDEWWRWWNDRNESFDVGIKTRQTSSRRNHFYSCEMPKTPEPPPTTETALTTVEVRCECLAPGTEIWTDAGLVAVDLIRTGDLVLSQHPETGELAYKAVLQPTNRAPDRLIRIRLGEEVVRATGGHPFWVSGKGWVKARRLEPGMALHGVRGSQVIEEAQIEDEPVKAFNLIVADFHTYFVGKHRVLSHDNTVREPVVVPVPGLTAE